MTVSIKFSLNGFEEYLERIAKAGRDIDDAADSALAEAAEVVQAEMQDLAPVDTGNLRDHIRIKGPIQDGNYHVVEIGVIHDKSFTDDDTARYGNVQEYGSAHTPAHPYIRPGIDRSRRAAIETMKESLKQRGMI